MKLFRALSLFVLLIVFSSVASAQEGESYKLVDEVIARVNTAVIMRSEFEKAQRDFLEELKGRGLKDEELEKKFNEIKPQILDSLIDQHLLIQRAKDLSLDKDSDTFVNQQLVRIMKDNNIPTVEELEQKMREVGVDINEVRRNLRNQFQVERVRQIEVYGQIARHLTEEEKRDYYEKHKEVFAVPGEISLSRILIQPGKDPAEALARANDVISQARGGADFCALARRYSEEALGQKCGKMDVVKMDLLLDEVRNAVAAVAVGAVTDPLKLQDGYVIFRVDERKEPKTRAYEDEEVKQEVLSRIVYERAQDHMDEYLTGLRRDAFIEIDARYQLPGMKVQSAAIKRVPFSDETEKERKKREKREKKEREQQKKNTDNAAVRTQG